MFRRRKQRRAEKEEEFADLSLGGDSQDGVDDIEAWIAEGPGGAEGAASRHRSDDEPEPVAPADDDLSADFDDHFEAKPAVRKAPVRRVGGPWDVTEDPNDGLPRIDLGALRLPTPPDVELRLEADQNGQIVTVALIHGTSTLNLGVFAAPRSEGIWDEVREDLRDSINSDGGQANFVDGDYGTELSARVPTPEGPQPLRFVGVDGPRWFVRAVYSGPAAIDPANAGPLADVMRGLVVVRGEQPMPVRDPLPLVLPTEITEQAEAAAADAQGEEDDSGGRHRKLDLPRRGPEITETH
ncbi:DUF3710 domain-containing protein [Fodinicola feengrottensis]|uniref:DUF3710 domain-containing protein n=1 Tax=Fodinicola feengrottensis TaxID=435914 RepID=UPI0024416732|nr:DUF3710 domain-containing protein [Fodinicola feengrottensis]